MVTYFHQWSVVFKIITVEYKKFRIFRSDRFKIDEHYRLNVWYDCLQLYYLLKKIDRRSALFKINLVSIFKFLKTLAKNISKIGSF